MVAKQNNEFLMKNHNLQPNESIPFPKVNGTAFPEVNAISSHKFGRARRYGRARGRGRFHGGGHNAMLQCSSQKHTAPPEVDNVEAR